MKAHARIGPNAVTQLARAFDALYPARKTDAFARAQVTDWLEVPPHDMVDETAVARLHQTVRQIFAPEEATALLMDAGQRTADYILDHRIPRIFRMALPHLSAGLAARLLTQAISRHAWTFAGTGKFRIVSQTPLTLEIADNPMCRGEHGSADACAWHRGVFTRLFAQLVHPQARTLETACCAAGDPACRFVIRWDQPETRSQIKADPAAACQSSSTIPFASSLQRTTTLRSDLSRPRHGADSALLALYARRAVPRYTSYPTAPHFQKDFPEEIYRSWLGALAPHEAVSLYVHIPFCQQMCWYCGCNMKLIARYQPVRSYVDNLCAEIDLVAAQLPARMRVAHLHFGGGTPTAIHTHDLEKIVRKIEEHFTFTADAERAIETDPRTITDEMITRIGALGFNRASLGVQEFDPRVQAAINRIQPAALVQETTEKLRAVGVKGINYDLIYGLPQQTEAALCKTVEECVVMQPDRIVLFGYAHVPWMAKNQRMIDEDALPGAEERAAQARSSAQALIAGGYQPIGIDHFALPGDALAKAADAGKLHRNFQGYTDDDARALIGFGATAIGRTPFGYVQNQPETGAWARAIQAGRLPVSKGHAMRIEDCLRAYVIERIMCDGDIDLEVAAAFFDVAPDWYMPEVEQLEILERDGLITRRGPRLTLTPAGAGLARVVAATFDTYLLHDRARHSVAV